MTYISHTKQKGFTLVETLVAVFILTLSIGALLSLAAGGFYSVKYARNQIVATNLMQESLEYIRNSRDTALQKGMTWADWQKTLQVDESGVSSADSFSGCFSDQGCIVDPYNKMATVRQCGASCPPVLYYPDNSFYGYAINPAKNSDYPFTPISAPYQTSFVRSINISSAGDPNQIQIDEVVTWFNGSVQKTVSQSMLLTNWKP
jgi:type II secretory pathway pseudopilin PulG